VVVPEVSELARPLSAGRREVLNRRARLLAWTTIGYNLAEGAVAVVAGTAAGSVALVSFGLDSGIEVLSAAAVAWQFGGGGDPRLRERRTLRLVALSFFALAAYVTVSAIRSLLGTGEPQPSPVGICLAVTSLIVMPALAWAKRRTGHELASSTVAADSTQTMLCTYLSAVLLVGLVLSATLGWSWADPLAALLIAGFATREGVQAWRGAACCEPALAAASCGCSAGCTDACRVRS
jgi:divalent metal cation (Fe/Co/Zn/Cd) transporter